MKKLQKLIEYGKNYTEYKPVHDELKKLQNGWTNKRDKYEEAPPRRVDPMERSKPLSPCKSAERNKDLAYCGMGTGICRPQNTEGQRLCQTERYPAPMFPNFKKSANAWILHSAPTSRSRHRPAQSGTT